MTFGRTHYSSIWYYFSGQHTLLQAFICLCTTQNSETALNETFEEEEDEDEDGLEDEEEDEDDPVGYCQQVLCTMVIVLFVCIIQEVIDLSDDEEDV